jgi:hypothetical protein
MPAARTRHNFIESSPIANPGDGTTRLLLAAKQKRGHA